MLYKGLLGRAKTPSVRPCDPCGQNTRAPARHPLRSSQTLISSLAHVTTWALSSLSQAKKDLHLCSLRTPCEAATKQSQACTAFADMHVKKPAPCNEEMLTAPPPAHKAAFTILTQCLGPRVLWPNKGTEKSAAMKPRTRALSVPRYRLGSHMLEGTRLQEVW